VAYHPLISPPHSCWSSHSGLHVVLPMCPAQLCLGAFALAVPSACFCFCFVSCCFSSAGVWTQGLHLEPLHQPFLW
jgi:hypothetical protein